jgi:FkbM family methyltransferase
MKYLVLIALSFSPARFDVAPLSLMVRNIIGLGTLQSRIVDFYEDIEGTCFLGTAPIIIDVGANVGQFASASKLFYPRARVICFEPDPDTFAALKENTAGFSAIELHNVGLGKRAGNLTFYRHEVSEMSSFSPRADDPVQRRGTTELPVRRLDDMISPDVRPDLLKIDVEGFERQVLEGGWETLSRSRYLLIEVSFGGGPGKDNLRLLRDIIDHAPAASVLRFGRLLGEAHRPLAQDVVVSLQPEGQLTSD